MTTRSTPATRHSNAYNIFILVLTVLSLAIMVLLLLPFSAATHELLNFYDNVVCVVFLIDFAINMKQSPSKRGYFIRERGWLDLLGSIPSFGFFRASGLFRLARLSRLARITRLLRGQNKKALTADVLHNRAHYAALITVLMAYIVLTVGSIVVLSAESHSPDANIKTGGDAMWWSVVTITTVGYGDFYPVTTIGRIGATFIMVMGIGIIGALASIMASVLVGGESDDSTPDSGTGPAGVESELAAIRSELVALRELVARLDGGAGVAALPAEPQRRETRSADRATERGA